MYPVRRMNLMTVLARLRAMDGAALDSEQANLKRRLHERLDVLNAKANRERLGQKYKGF